MLKFPVGRCWRIRRLGILAAGVAISAGAGAQIENGGATARHADQASQIHLDVVVSDMAGRPVSGLKAKDFTFLDDGKPRQIAEFKTFDGATAKPEAPVKMIIVIDAVNNGFVEMAYLRQGLEEFLRENDGRLGQPTMIAKLASSGIQTLSSPTVDGTALANIVGALSPTVKPRGLDALHVSLSGLMAIAQNEVNEPGRKLLVWLGPGWPTPVPPRSALTEVDLRNQRTYFAVAIQIAKLLRDSHMVLYGGYSGGDFYMRDFLKPMKKVSDVDARILRLNVLAIKSGGKGELPETNRDSVVRDALDHVAAEGKSFYEISFEPPKAQAVDEFHELRVTVDRPGLTARTATGYYNQLKGTRPETKKQEASTLPEPTTVERRAERLVTVAQLKAVVQELKGKQDGERPAEIERLRLTERLSSSKLAELSAELAGAKSREALLAVADASTFLDPPKEELPDKAVPSAAEQRDIASRAVVYLKDAIPKLPNFYAKRFTTSFKAVRSTYDMNLRTGDEVWRNAGKFKAMVLYRDGKEEVRSEGAEERHLITRGTFGPILSTVIVDAARSSTEWARWEERPSGPMAVMKFRVLKKQSHYQVSYPTAMNGDGELSGMAPTAYHGEIGIDPKSGAILRLVLEADPESGSAMHRADIMVEYGAVTIGGQAYTCPVRGVSISVGEQHRLVNEEGVASVPDLREMTWLDDVVFRDYHVFRSEMRIVPD